MFLNIGGKLASIKWAIHEKRTNPKIFNGPNKEIKMSTPKVAKTLSTFMAGYQGNIWGCYKVGTHCYSGAQSSCLKAHGSFQITAICLHCSHLKIPANTAHQEERGIRKCTRTSHLLCDTHAAWHCSSFLYLPSNELKIEK